MAAAGAEKALGHVMKASLGFAGLAAIPSCIFDVDGGERAVVLNMFSGVEEKVRGEGTHFKIPWVMQPKSYTIRLRPKEIKSNTGTKDLQTITIGVRVLFKPEITGLQWIHNNYGPEYDEKLLPSFGNEIVKATIAQYNAEQLLTHREHVSSEIRDAIVARAKSFHILIDDVSIIHLKYGKEFEQAIEQKQVAEQEAEQQKYIVQRAEQERQAQVIRAEGTAEAAQMIADAVKECGRASIEVSRIDAAKEIAERLSKSPNVMYVPSGQQMLLNLGGGGAQRPPQQ